MKKYVFNKEKLKVIDTVFEKHILSFSRPASRGNLKDFIIAVLYIKNSCQSYFL